MMAADIARALGNAQREGSNWRCLCPLHRGRSLSLRDGTQGRLLVTCWGGCDRRDIFRELYDRGLLDRDNPLGLLRVPDKRPIGTERTAQALAIWDNSAPIFGTLGEVYLRTRIRREMPPECVDVRFHPRCTRGTGDRRELHPAIVALLRGIHSDKPIAIQRTFLKSDGSDRLRDEMGRATLGPSVGAVVKLVRDQDVTMGLGIAEGLEKALALLAIGWRPIWSTGGSATMASFPVLAGVETLTIFADADESGQQAAHRCAERWIAAGREVLIRTPFDHGDFNDALGAAA